MPLTVMKRGGKEFLYITLSGSRKLYLGTAIKPRLLALLEAVEYLNTKIAKYMAERSELKKILKKHRKRAASEIQKHRAAIEALNKLLER